MTLYTIPSEQLLEENKRIEALDSYGILDTIPEKEYDDITALASKICEVKVSLIALMDRKRNWYKSTHGDVGYAHREMPREYSFCRITIQKEELLEIPDTTKDIRFKDNPVVVNAPYVRYYAGYPLINDEGYKLGTLCLVDTVPKRLTPIQRETLRILANQVMKSFEARVKHEKLEKQTQELVSMNTKLDQFAELITHDLKGPLENTSTLFELLERDESRAVSYKEKIKLNLSRMAKLVDGLFDYAKSDRFSFEKEEVDVYQLVENLTNNFANQQDVIFNIDQSLPIINTEKILLQQVFQNLVSNAVKFNNNSQPRITIEHKLDDGNHLFYVVDDGVGIPAGMEQKIFEPFVVISRHQRSQGSGVGLALVKKIIEEKQGEIWVESSEGNGSSFNFIWKA